jgi:hypothetical protein
MMRRANGRYTADSPHGTVPLLAKFHLRELNAMLITMFRLYTSGTGSYRIPRYGRGSRVSPLDIVLEPLTPRIVDADPLSRAA